DDLDQRDLMDRFLRWWRHAENAVNGRVFDIGITTCEALERYEQDGDPAAGDLDPSKAGNGSLMRVAPVAIRWHGEPAKAAEAARTQSVTTHAASASVDGCAYWVGLLVRAIGGEDKKDLLEPVELTGNRAVAAIASGSWRGKGRDQIRSSGYVVHTLEAALWSVNAAEDFEAAILCAANLADDADTVAAVTRQLAGAIWGASGIPMRWRERLAWHEHIEERAATLFEKGLASKQRR